MLFVWFCLYCFCAGLHLACIRLGLPTARYKESFGNVCSWGFGDHVVYFIFLVPLVSYTLMLEMTDILRITKTARR